MPMLKGIECWLEDADDGQRFEEYETRYWRERNSSTFVESEHGKSFSINWKVHDPLLGGHSFAVSFEKVPIRHPAVDANVKHTRVVGIQKSEITFLPFVFDLNNINEEKEIPKFTKEFEEDNKIMLKIWRSGAAGYRDTDFSSIVEDKQKLKKKTIGLKAKAAGLRDYVGYGEDIVEKLKPMSDSGSLIDPIWHPYVEFVFYYRSSYYLEKAGIIPKDGEKKRTSPNDRKRKALATPPNEEVDEDDKLSYTRKLEETITLLKRRAMWDRKVQHSGPQRSKGNSRGCGLGNHGIEIIDLTND